MRLPTIERLQNMQASDAHAILNAKELELEGILDVADVAFDYRGAAYHKGLARRKLKRVAEIRASL